MSDYVHKGQTQCSHNGGVVGIYEHRCCGGKITKYEKISCTIPGMGIVTVRDTCRLSCPYNDSIGHNEIAIKPPSHQQNNTDAAPHANAQNVKKDSAPGVTIAERNNFKQNMTEIWKNLSVGKGDKTLRPETSKTSPWKLLNESLKRKPPQKSSPSVNAQSIWDSLKQRNTDNH